MQKSKLPLIACRSETLNKQFLKGAWLAGNFTLSTLNRLSYFVLSCDENRDSERQSKSKVLNALISPSATLLLSRLSNRRPWNGRFCNPFFAGFRQQVQNGRRRRNDK